LTDKVKAGEPGAADAGEIEEILGTEPTGKLKLVDIAPLAVLTATLMELAVAIRLAGTVPVS
jgi:hypothetical protein